jgi:2-dehydro-3-deoxyphosphooctonate aldolase (KDO 8-P synthase)
MKQIRLHDFAIGGGAPFVLIAGPCVIEDERQTHEIARYLKDLTESLDIPFIFKASYDKANRTSFASFRGPGCREGLAILARIKEELNIPVLSDVHRFEEIEAACAVLDVVQVPAFLCRQTDFVAEIARQARIINIKKGQFLSPWEVGNIVKKAEEAGSSSIMITERGASFGYNNLVVDFRSFPILRAMGYPVVFDGTHSVQLPGGAGTASGGQRDMAGRGSSRGGRHISRGPSRSGPRPVRWPQFVVSLFSGGPSFAPESNRRAGERTAFHETTPSRRLNHLRGVYERNDRCSTTGED